MILKHLFLLFLTFTSVAFAGAAEPSRHVLVSVAPYQYFIEKIAGDTVTLGLMVPAGASSHTYEPTPKQILAASQADLWFCLGESFEKRAMQALSAYNQRLKVIDLRKGVAMITADPHSGQCCCHANGQDLHIWTSLRQAKTQAETIASALIEHYPEHAERYRAGLKALLQEFDQLDQEMAALLKPLKQRTILVSHPAYAYFCRDYQLTQLSIEVEGKDPTPQQLNKILTKARQAGIKKVFIQMQYGSKGAHLFARELGAEVITLDPYSPDYLNSMRSIAHAFAS